MGGASGLTRLAPTGRQSSVAAEMDRLAPVLDELGALFAEAGHELALVGGPVRDAMLGRPSKDLDLTTSARPDVTERILNAIEAR